MNRLNSSLLEGGVGASGGVEVHDIASVGVWVLLPLVEAPPASLSSPPGRRLWQGLWQACRPAIASIQK